MGRRLGAGLAVAGLLALAAGSHTAPAVVQQAADRPNIVVIQTDDQTVDSMHVMANVDRLLVKEGARFVNSFATYPLCCPSRATFLTGQYAHNHGVLGNEPPLGGYPALDHTNTLPLWLQRAGYHTSFVGKYLNGYGESGSPNTIPPGWSDWRAALRNPGSKSLLYLGFTLNENGELVSYPRGRANYLTDVFTRHAVDAVELGAASGAPFFLWLSYFAPHGGRPLDPDDVRAPGIGLSPRPAARHKDAYAGEVFLRSPSFDERDVSDKPPAVRNRKRLTETQIAAIEELRQQRLESLLAVDEGVAQVVEALGAAGELENTLIVFTSDNGFIQGEHRIPPDRGRARRTSRRCASRWSFAGPGFAAPGLTTWWRTSILRRRSSQRRRRLPVEFSTAIRCFRSSAGDSPTMAATFCSSRPRSRRFAPTATYTSRTAEERRSSMTWSPTRTSCAAGTTIQRFGGSGTSSRGGSRSYEAAPAPPVAKDREWS